MTSGKFSVFLLLISLASVPVVEGVFAYQARSLPVASDADRTGTQVTVRGDRFDITGGQRSRDGANLFHSFREFGLDANQIANFISNPSIQNILGRINGGNPSIINGLLQVTGGNSNLYLMNPSGILFGPNARLDVPASFTATTATGIGFDDGWFNTIGENRYESLVGSPSAFAFDAAELGSIVNSAQLAVGEQQNLSLLGGVVVNTGSLSAPVGQVTIMAVPPSESGVPLVRLSQTGHVLSLDIQAPGTTAPLGITSLPLEFTVASLPQLLTGGDGVGATGLTINSSGQAVLTGSGIPIPSSTGTVVVSGMVDVSSTFTQAAPQIGGTVQILGRNVGLVNSTINASGAHGGGTVLVGGEYQGNGSLPNAVYTYISRDSTINADSLLDGDGGRVIAWADQTTAFYGTINARGGSISGDGGFVEVSGRENLGFYGTVRVDADNGEIGTLLLDPDEIIITCTSSDPNICGVSLPPGQPVDFLNFPANGTVYISEEALESFSGNLILQARNSIRILPLVRRVGVVEPGLADNILRLNGITAGQTVTLETLDPNGIVSVGVGGNVSLRTGGGNIRVRTAGFGGLSAVNAFTGGSFNIITQGGSVDIETRIYFQAGLLGQGINTSSLTGRGGDVRIVDPSASSSGTPGSFSFSPTAIINTQGPLGGGNVTLDTVAPLSLSRILTGSINGDGGNVVIKGANQGAAFSVSVDTSSCNPAACNSSSSSGRAGNVELTVSNPSPESNRLTIEASAGSSGVAVRAVGLAGGGNVTLTADEIDFPAGAVIDRNFDGNPDPAEIRISGVLRLQPFSPGQAIVLGEASEDIVDASSLSLSLEDLGALVYVGDPGSPDDGILPIPANQVSGGIIVGGSAWTGNIVLPNPIPLTSAITVQSGGNATLTGPDVATTYTFTGGNGGEISGFNNPTFDTDPITPGLQSIPELRFQNIGQIIAGQGDDTFAFNNNSSYSGSIASGSGNNVIDLSDFTSPLDVDLARNPSVVLVNNPTFQIIGGTSSDITGVIGGISDDLLRGDDRANILDGGPGGNDQLFGRGGDDQLTGGTGIDTFDGGTGLNRVIETRDDVTSFSMTDTTLQVGAESGETLTNIQAVTLIGGNTPTTFTVSNWSGVDATLIGGTGADVFSISAVNGTGRVNADGGRGSDTYNVSLIGGGTTTINDTGIDAGANDVLRITGSDSADQFFVSTGQIRLASGGQFISFRGVETQSVNGLGGNDSFDISNLTDPLNSIVVNGDEGDDTFTVSNNVNGRVNIDGGDGNDGITVNLRGIGFGTTTVIGSPGSDSLTLNGTSGADQMLISEEEVALRTERVSFNPGEIDGGLNVNTLAGDDTFRFSSDGIVFNGVLDGGSGSDTLDYSVYTTPVIANLETGAVPGGAVLIVGTVENIIGGSAADVLTGDSNSNRLEGRAGDDQLFGEAGDDTLNGNEGIDTFNGGDGTDRLIETRDANFTLTDSSLTIGTEGTDTLTSVEAATLTGGAGDNTFTVNTWSGAATLDGAAGNDAYTVNASPTGAGSTAVTDSGTTGTDALTVNGTDAADQIGLTTGRVTVNNQTVTYSGTESLAVNGVLGDDAIAVSNSQDSATVDGGAGSDRYTITYNGSGSGTTTVTDTGTTGTDALTVTGTTGNDQLALTTGRITRGTETVTYSGTETQTVTGNTGDDTFTVTTLSDTVTLDGNDGSDTFAITYSGTGSGTTTVNDTGTVGTDTLAVNGTGADDAIALTPTQITLGSETVNNSGGTENLAVNGQAGNDGIAINGAINQPGDISLIAETITSAPDGTLTSGGTVTATADNGIAVGTVTAIRGITLTSENGSVTSGDLITSNAQRGGAIRVEAGDRITTGIIDSSADVGRGGNVALEAENDIEVTSINTQGGTSGRGGNVNVDTNGLFRVTGSFRTQGRLFSIATAGGNGNGSITIEYDGDRRAANTFTIGNAARSGTARGITTGTTSLFPVLSVTGGVFEQDNIRITNLNPAPQPPDPQPPQPSFNLEVLEVDPVVNLIFPVCPAPVVITTEGLDEDAQGSPGETAPVCSPIGILPADN